MSLTFGLIIDESGVPGLHPSVEDAKKQVESEIIECLGPVYWARHGRRIDWQYPIDASYERPIVYYGDAEWASDEFIDYQVWEVMLWDSDSLAK